MKTFEWGLLKICCAFLCMLTLLTACSNEELVENTSNCVGEEYVEIEGEKTSNGSQEHVTVDELKELPAIIAEAKQICNEKELAIDEFYTFAYGDKFVTVCGAVEQMHNFYMKNTRISLFLIRLAITNFKWHR